MEGLTPAAILIDVTIVRALLVPGAMKLFGKWTWWLPDGLARESIVAGPARCTRAPSDRRDHRLEPILRM